ncbi:MAG: glutathione-regulated potassium-efflux system ancillary protein KefC [Motiliproteus sp.]|jgi:glutathione-regulated potassium-efflux system ancillary protein KefC
MDPLWILTAFGMGFLAQLLRLPPLVGFLGAGFALHALGAEGGPLLQQLADLGVTLLLFTIGLKLRPGSLFAVEVWGSAAAHMALSVLLAVGLLLLLGVTGLGLFALLDWQAAAVIGFALSFSSTVFAIKILEERAELKSRHGQIAIGILIIQDIFAVLFLTLATDKTPTLWAFALLALPLIRPLLGSLLSRSGHGEVLVLYGLLIAVCANALFEQVGIKGDLGALIIGALLSSHSKSTELARSLLSFKDLLLLGFFLSIGINALPGWTDLAVAIGLVVLLLPLKTLLFLALLASFRLRARTAFLSALSLANYSEFGLIVTAVGVSAGWVNPQWLMIMALALALSFVFAALLNTNAHSLYASVEAYLRPQQTLTLRADDQPIDLGDAEVLVMGVGRVGCGALIAMQDVYGDRVCGIDSDAFQVRRHQQAGRNVRLGDAEDADFWEGLDATRLRLVMLTLPTLGDMLQTVTRIRAIGYRGPITAVAKHEDERQQLERVGVRAAFNFYAEAGAGFAAHVLHNLPLKELPLDKSPLTEGTAEIAAQTADHQAVPNPPPTQTASESSRS